MSSKLGSMPNDDATFRYDPLDLEADPYPVYRRLRAEFPVYRGETAGRSFWAISKFADIDTAMRDWRTFSSAQGNDLDDCGELFGAEPALDLADPPVHTRQKEALRAAMTAPEIQKRLTPLIGAKIELLLQRARDETVFDVARDLAYVLPMETICSWLGYPESDFRTLRNWHERMLVRLPGNANLPGIAIEARNEMWGYVRSAISERVKNPRTDLLSVIARAQANGQLSPGEALANAIFLFDAGIVSTSALISSALVNLHEWPIERLKLWQKPSLLNGAIEEFLRFEPPFQWFTRVTTRDVAFASATIPAGSRVVLIWASGNRCESAWDEGESLIVDRPRQRHFSFSGGIHLCLGAPLARLEVGLLFRHLIERVDSYAIAGPIQRRITPSERTISSLPIRFSWRD